MAPTRAVVSRIPRNALLENRKHAQHRFWPRWNPAHAEQPLHMSIHRPHARETLLMVGNYRPDEGFAWWLMEHFWVELAALGREQGLEPLIAYPTDGRIPGSIQDAKIETIIQPFTGRGAKDFFRAIRLVRSRRIRFIYLTDRAFTSVAYLVFRLLGVRVILNHDHTPGDRPPVGGIKGFLKATWHRLPLLSCDLQICVAPIIRERAIRNARIPPQRAVVVQNGIDPVTCDGDPSYAHQEFGFPLNAVICVNTGRAHPYKRVDFFIEVARICIQETKLDQLYFLHCGDGPDLARLQRMVSEAGIASRVFLAGRRTDIRQILCSATFALHPARGEAFSLAIVEYLSAGLVVLVPDLPSVRQAIRDGTDGIVFEDGNPHDAARHIENLLLDADRRHAMQAMAQQTVRERFTLQTMDQQFRTVVREQLEKMVSGSSSQQRRDQNVSRD
jgi:glycosyltransferase involved in cell wall biosynthesis